MRRQFTHSCIAVFGLLCPVWSAFGQASFTPIVGTLGGSPSTNALAISADGSTVVGSAHSGNGVEPYYWTRQTGMVALNWSATSYTSSVRAFGVSADGGVIVGSGRVGSEHVAYRWSASTGMTQIPDRVDGIAFDEAMSVSADGLVLIGRGRDGSTPKAMRYSASEGLSTIDGDNGYSVTSAEGISADGSVVVGSVIGGEYFSEPYRWTESGGVQPLGVLEHEGFLYGSGQDVNSTGDVVVGNLSGTFASEAFRWTESGGMEALGDLPGGDHNSVALGVSGDGSAVVGYSIAADGQHAFVWTQETGMLSIWDILTSAGVDVSEWTHISAHAIADDNRTIVGTMYDVDGHSYGWVAVIPSPSGAILLWAWCFIRARRANR